MHHIYRFCLCFLLLFPLTAFAQVADYAFETDFTSYRQLGNGVVLTDDATCTDDTLFQSIVLPFTFTYCGVNFDTISVSSNGYLTFGASTTQVTSDVLATIPNTIAAFATDLYACATNHDLVYATYGVAPNRQFVVQWNNWGLQPSGAGEFNVQVRLYEGTNKIQILYGSCSGATPANITVGISGNTIGDFQTRTTTTDWEATTSGAITDKCTYTTTVNPDYGLIMQWSSGATAAAMSFSSYDWAYWPIQAGEATIMTTLNGCYDDQASDLINLPFTFFYHNTPFTSLGIHANGYIKLGDVAPLVYSQVLSNETDIIAVFANDLYGCAPGRDISYGVTGTAPNRSFIIQWTNWGFYNYGFSEFSAQIILQEGDNTIQFRYGPGFPFSYKSITVGLSGETLSDFHTRKTNFNWYFTSKGLNNTATCNFSPYVYPINGLNFTFTPPEGCTAAPDAGIAFADSVNYCPQTALTLHLQSADAGPDITYQWQIAPHPDSTFIDVSGAVDSTYSFTLDTSAVYRCVLTCTVSELWSASVPVEIEVLPQPSINIIGATDSSTCAGSEIILQIETDSLNTIQWLRYDDLLLGDTTDILHATTSGVYTTLVSDGVCKSTSSPMLVSIYPLPEIVTIDASTDTTCVGAEITLTASGPAEPVILYEEYWDETNYAVSGWTNPDACDNWTGWMDYTPDGASAPTAYFSWTPGIINYSCSIISPVIDATGSSDVLLNYLLLLDNFTSATIEQFTVTYKAVDDMEWDTLEIFTNSIGAGVETYTRTNQLLSDMQGKRFQIQFTASGESAFSINAWGIDNIVVTGNTGYTYNWYSEPTAFSGSGISTNATVPSPGTYTFYTEVTDSLTGCVTTSEGKTIVFTDNETYFADTDADTYGDAASFIIGCGLPIGYVLNDDDCDDASAFSFPGNPEVCDGLDNDCDGNIDNFIIATVSPAGPISICSGTTQVLTCSTGAGYTYKWKRNGNYIPGATTSSFTVTKAGTYACEITVAPDCIALSNEVVISISPLPTATITNMDFFNNLCFDPSIKLKANGGGSLLYQWLRNGNPIAGATDIAYFATTAGNYRVTVTNIYGCSKTSVIYTIINTCHEESTLTNVKPDLRFWPNPTSGIISTEMHFSNYAQGNANIDVYDIQGNFIASYVLPVIDGQVFSTITLPDYCASGMYILRTTTETSSATTYLELIR